MKKNLFFISIFLCLKALAQTPDDALRTAWFTQNGTARMMAVGGVNASLGGDISSANINPAGLGFYKTKEFVLSPGFAFNNNKLNYRGTDTATQKSNFMYGPIGFVLGSGNTNKYSKWTSSAFSISVNQLANYNNHIQYSGLNNYSSFTEQYLEELVRDRADTNAALDNYIFGSSLAFRTYLIDTTRIGNQIGYKSLVPISSGVNQSYDANTKGGYHEIAIGLAGNLEDKLYVGGSLTIPITYYSKDFYFSEKDATANANNNFSNFTYHESTTSNGVGIGMKLGMIYKPQENLRLGFAFHTPQFMNYKDQIRSWLSANTEKYAGQRSESSDHLNSGNPGDRSYNLLTPWRAIVSASFIFKEDADVKNQQGFISADIEYVNYRGARFSARDNTQSSLVDYYNLINKEIKDYYKGNVNIRVGGELKFSVWMLRLGTAYYGSPYADASLKANRFIASGGIGYRDHGMFIDLAYSQVFANDVNFPYRLNDVANTYATQKGGYGNLVMTIGFKL